MNRSSKLSDKNQLFKIKSKPQRQHSQAITLAVDPLHSQLQPSISDQKPIFDKTYIADAKGWLISFC